MKIDNFEKWNNEQMTENQPEKYYRRANFVIRLIEKKRIEKVVELTGARPDEKILEVGCGQGHILELIREGSLYGLDLSDKMLADASARLKDRAKLLKADAEDFAGCYDVKFDKVICSEVLEHTREPRKVVSEIGKVLKDDGSLIVSIPNEGLINRIKKVLIKLKIFDLFFGNISKDATKEFHLHSFDLLMLRRITEGKFEIEKTVKIPFGFLPIRYVVKMRLCAE